MESPFVFDGLFREELGAFVVAEFPDDLGVFFLLLVIDERDFGRLLEGAATVHTAFPVRGILLAAIRAVHHERCFSTPAVRCIEPSLSTLTQMTVGP
jgi:hypothetical protein